MCSGSSRGDTSCRHSVEQKLTNQNHRRQALLTDREGSLSEAVLLVFKATPFYVLLLLLFEEVSALDLLRYSMKFCMSCCLYTERTLRFLSLLFQHKVLNCTEGRKGGWKPKQNKKKHAENREGNLKKYITRNGYLLWTEPC